MATHTESRQPIACYDWQDAPTPPPVVPPEPEPDFNPLIADAAEAVGNSPPELQEAREK